MFKPLFLLSALSLLVGTAAFAQPWGYDQASGKCWGKGYSAEADSKVSSKTAHDMAEQYLRGPSLDELIKTCNDNQGGVADFDKIQTQVLDHHFNSKLKVWVNSVIVMAPCQCDEMNPPVLDR